MWIIIPLFHHYSLFIIDEPWINNKILICPGLPLGCPANHHRTSPAETSNCHGFKRFGILLG